MTGGQASSLGCAFALESICEALRAAWNAPLATERSQAEARGTELYRSVWNRVHSRRRRELMKGKEQAEAWMLASDLDAQLRNDVGYLVALANSKLGSRHAAHRQLVALLEVTHTA